MKRAPAIVTSLVAILFIVAGPFALTLQPARADVGIQGQWITLANGDDIRGLAMAGNVVWAGTHNGGVVSWDPFDKSYTQYLAPQTGLAGNDVRAVASDGLYTLWFATNNGVSQFEPGDGRWTTFMTANGLASNNATAVAYGPDGSLWVGTSQSWNGNEWSGGGLSIRQGSDWVTYTVDNSDLPSNNITDIAFAGSDVWIGTRPYKVFVEATGTAAAHWRDEGGGVALLSGGQWRTFNRDDSDLSDNRINAVATAPDDRVWFATPSGLVVYNQAEDVWYTYRTGDGLDANATRDVTVDSSGRVWALSYNSETTPVGALNLLEGDTWSMYSDEDGLSSRVLWAVLADNQGRIWVGTGPWCKVTSGCEGGGLTQYQPSANSWQAYRMSDSHLVSNQITAVAVQDDGALWIGTQGSGVSLRDANGEWRHFTEENSDLASKLVRSLAIGADGSVWIGTQQYVKDGAWAGGGLNRYQDGEWTIFDKDNSPLPTNEVKTIEIDADGLVWLGTGDLYDGSGGGLAAYDPVTKTWRTYTVDDGLPSNLVADIAFDPDAGAVWAATAPYNVGGATGGGLAVFENATWSSFTAANSEIPTWSGDDVTGDFRAVVVDEDGNPWAGTWDSVGHPSQTKPYFDAIVTHRENGQWTETTFPQQGFISSMILAPDATLWAGIGQDGMGDQTTRGGLRARIDGTWTAATTATSPLAGNDITSLALRSNGDLWIGTVDAGLSRLRNAQPGPTPTNTAPPTDTPAPTDTPGTPGPAPSITNTPVPVTPTPGGATPPAEVPEAATIILLGSGLAGLGGYAAYRWRARNGGGKS
ncbi:MAG: two-component regulator propeller domain-containing protein [Anaerolineae bacterium]